MSLFNSFLEIPFYVCSLIPWPVSEEFVFVIESMITKSYDSNFTAASRYFKILEVSCVY